MIKYEDNPVSKDRASFGQFWVRGFRLSIYYPVAHSPDLASGDFHIFPKFKQVDRDW